MLGKRMAVIGVAGECPGTDDQPLFLRDREAHLDAELVGLARPEGYGGISVGQSKIKLSQERLALMLSLSRQTTNRLLKLLETQGIVHLRFGEIEILDMEKLRSAAVAGSSRGA